MIMEWDQVTHRMDSTGKWEPRNLAAESVMDLYVPHLDETNHQIRVQSGLHYALPTVRRQQDLYY